MISISNAHSILPTFLQFPSISVLENQHFSPFPLSLNLQFNPSFTLFLYFILLDLVFIKKMKERHHRAVFFPPLNSLAYLYVYLHCYSSYIKMDKVSLFLEKSNSYTYVLDSISSHLLKILLLQLPFLSYVITFFLSAGSLTSALQHACSVSILNCPLMLCVLSATELYLCFSGQQNFRVVG